MLITALVPSMGYERAAAIAKYAQDNGSKLIDAAFIVEGISEIEFSKLVQPKKMIGNYFK
jgi:fumarate hydratase class II